MTRKVRKKEYDTFLSKATDVLINLERQVAENNDELNVCYRYLDSDFDKKALRAKLNHDMLEKVNSQKKIFLVNLAFLKDLLPRLLDVMA